MGSLSRREHATVHALFVSSTFCFSLNQGPYQAASLHRFLFVIISLLCIKMAGSMTVQVFAHIFFIHPLFTILALVPFMTFPHLRDPTKAKHTSFT